MFFEDCTCAAETGKVCIRRVYDPADAPDSPALSGVISDLIFTFTPAFPNCFCPNLSGATEYRSRRNNLLKYRPIYIPSGFHVFHAPKIFFMYLFSAHLFNSQIIAFEKALLHEDYIKVSKSLWDTARLAQKLLSIIIAGSTQKLRLGIGIYTDHIKYYQNNPNPHQARSIIAKHIKRSEKNLNALFQEFLSFPTALQNPGVRFKKVEGPTFYTIGGGATMVGADEPKKIEKYAL